MLSKISAVALLAGTSQALTQGGTSYGAALTCTQCVMNNYKWCADTADFYQSATSALATDKCVEVWTACSTKSTNSNLRVYNNKDIELAACPQLQSECGATTTFTLSAASGTQTVASTGAIAQNTKCSYVVKSTAGPLMYQYGGTSTDGTDLEISFAQWTDDARVTMDTTKTFFPSAASSSHFVDTTSMASSVVVIPRGKVENGFTSDLAFDTMKTAIDTYNTAKTKYDNDVKSVLDTNEKIRPLNWWEQALGMKQDPWKECPVWIGEYTGFDMWNTASNGGYGDPTSGIYTISSTKNKLYWGKHGQTADTDKNIDRNTDLSANRYLLITYIAKTSSATAAKATGTVSVGTFDSTMTKYMAKVTAPTAKADCIGASWLSVGAAALAVAATLY